MTQRRCDTCEFWVLDDQWGLQQDVDPGSRVGGCHRHAPRSTTGEYEYRVLQALWLIAPDDKDLNDNWEEACLHKTVWPGTEADDWCGEWKQK